MLNVVDVSNYQDSIDAQNLPADAIIVKVSEGTNYINPSCNAQVAGTKAGGKKLGLYHFAQPGTDPITQANFFVNNVRNYIIDDHALPFLDWEADAVGLGPQWAAEWLDEVARLTGTSPMIYMSKDITNVYDWSAVAQYYGLWGAQYATNAPQYGFIPDPWTDDNPWGAWGVPTVFQFSSTGRLQGWGGDLDLSLAYLDGDSWDKFTTAGGAGQIVQPQPLPTPQFQQAAIDGIFYVDQLVNYGTGFYAINNDISLHPIDYNNAIPLGPLTAVDGHGNVEASQLLYAGAFFTFGDAVEETYFPVTYLNDSAICLTIGGEPVWLDRKALGDGLKLK